MHSSWPSKSSLVGFCLALGAGWTAAASIYDNGAPDHIDGWEMTSFVQADNFSIAKPARLDRVTFWEADALPLAFAGSFDWQIHSNASDDSPGDVIASGTSSNLRRVMTGAKAGGYPEYLVTFDIAPLALAPGVYWLALHNGPPSNSAGYVLYWETTAAGDSVVSHERFTAATAGPWFTNTYPGHSGELAFQVLGASAPDVSSLAFRADGLHLTIATELGYNYQVEYKDNINDATWSPLPGGEFVSGTGSPADVIDRTPNVRKLPHRFYRAKLL